MKKDNKIKNCGVDCDCPDYCCAVGYNASTLIGEIHRVQLIVNNPSRLFLTYIDPDGQTHKLKATSCMGAAGGGVGILLEKVK